MKSRSLLILALSVSLLPLLTSSLAAQSLKAADEIEFGDSDFMNKKEICHNVSMASGNLLKITLPSNASMPDKASAGFQWKDAQILDRNVLQQEIYQFIAPSGLELGATEREKWTFEAVQKGSTTVTIHYSQPWNGGEQDAFIFTLNITVVK